MYNSVKALYTFNNNNWSVDDFIWSRTCWLTWQRYAPVWPCPACSPSPGSSWCRRGCQTWRPQPTPSCWGLLLRWCTSRYCCLDLVKNKIKNKFKLGKLELKWMLPLILLPTNFLPLNSDNSRCLQSLWLCFLRNMDTTILSRKSNLECV